MRLRFPIPALVAASFLAVCAPCPAAYVTGVYWVEQDVYYLNLTLHNNEPDDEWWVFNTSISPGAFDAQAPPFWSVSWKDYGVVWDADDAHWLPPGEELSGFTFQTHELEDWYSYKIIAYGNHWTGYFQPELIPWPPGVGPVALGILGLWAARRLRRR